MKEGRNNVESKNKCGLRIGGKYELAVKSEEKGAHALSSTRLNVKAIN